MSLVKLLCVALFVALLAGVNWYVYVYVEHMEPSGRCSSTYPDHGVILDITVTLVDGSLQTEDGTVYPPGAFWVKDGVVRGCPCSIGPCVMSCCPVDYVLVEGWSCNGFEKEEEQYIEEDDQHLDKEVQYLEEDDQYFEEEWFYDIESSDPVYEVSTDVLEVFSGNDPLQKVNVSKDHYSVVSPIKYGGAIKAMDHILLDDGRIWNTAQSRYSRHELFCFNVRDNVLIDNTPFKYMFSNALIIYVKWYLEFKHAFIFIPTVLHAVTFVVFLLVSRLRSGCGKAIMNYVAAQFFKKFVMICSGDYDQHSINEFRDGLVVIGGPLVNSTSRVIQYFFEVSAHIWQLVIAFQLWSAFRPGRPCMHDHTSRRKTILYSALGWGVALVWTVVFHYALPKLLTQSGVYIHTYFLIQVIDIMQLVLAEIACLVLSVCAMCGLRAGKKNSEKLQKSNSQRHNTADIQWSSLFLNISLLTGIDYIFLNAYDLVDDIDFWMYHEFGIIIKASIPQFIKLTLIEINNIRGVEIFFIFVFKIEVLKSLAEKLRLRKKQPTFPWRIYNRDQDLHDLNDLERPH